MVYNDEGAEWVRDWVTYVMEADRRDGYDSVLGPRYSAWYAYISNAREAVGLPPLTSAIESVGEVRKLVSLGADFDAIKAAACLIHDLRGSR